MAVRRGRGTCVKRKDGLYQASISMGLDRDGRPLRPTAYGKTAAEAQEKLGHKVAEIRRGEYKRPDPLTVGKFLDDLLAARRASGSLRESTFSLYAGIVRKHIAPRIGEKRLDKVAGSDIDRLYGTLRRDGASERTVKFVHVILGMAFATALKAEKVVRNPVLRVTASPQYKSREQRCLTPEEGEALLQAARGDDLYALYVLALDTGARQGELFALRRADVDLKNRSVAIRRSVRYANDGRLLVTPTKTGRDRLVPISTRSATALRAHLKANMESEYLFTERKNGQPLRKENFIRRCFRPLLKKAGLPPIRFHDLRHSTATRLLSQGVHPKVVQERLGHSSITVTLDTYSHAIPSLGREAADLFDRALAE